MTQLYVFLFAAAVVLCAAGFVILRARKDGRRDAERAQMKMAVKDAGKAKKARERLVSDRDYAARVRDTYTRP